MTIIKHVMADGTVRDSIEGVEVPLTDETAMAYRVLAEVVEKPADVHMESKIKEAV